MPSKAKAATKQTAKPGEGLKLAIQAESSTPARQLRSNWLAEGAIDVADVTEGEVEAASGLHSRGAGLS